MCNSHKLGNCWVSFFNKNLTQFISIKLYKNHFNVTLLQFPGFNTRYHSHYTVKIIILTLYYLSPMSLIFRYNIRKKFSIPNYVTRKYSKRLLKKRRRRRVKINSCQRSNERIEKTTKNLARKSFNSVALFLTSMKYQ